MNIQLRVHPVYHDWKQLLGHILPLSHEEEGPAREECCMVDQVMRLEERADVLLDQRAIVCGIHTIIYHKRRNLIGPRLAVGRRLDHDDITDRRGRDFGKYRADQVR
jgi:hypothetical protein